jgi:uncharacterized RDD family membrane protein YckC
MELVDHVASAIEQELTANPEATFYDVFKQYMVENKKQLLKNYGDQKAKIKDKIFMRFGNGFLAKEVLFFIVASLLVSTYIDLSVFKEYFTTINVGLFLAVLLYYFVAFYKKRKTSIGKSLMVLFFISHHLIIYINIQTSLYIIVLLFFLVFKLEIFLKQKVEGNFHENWVFVVKAISFFAFVIPFLCITKWSKPFVTDKILASNFFFQLIMWYVLFKTLVGYKKELDVKYKSIFN